MYKIRNKETGLFSNGGAWPKWTKRGRTWSMLHHVRTHLKSNAAYKRRFYENAEIVAFEISIDSVTMRPIEDLL